MLFLLLAACAPKVPLADAAPAPEHPLLLWRVERAGKASHLLGTCHLGVSLDYALPKPHDATLNAATVVYTEADLDLGDPAGLVKLLYSDGPGLSERLDPERWRAVASAVRDTMPASMLDRMEPWAVSAMLPFLSAPPRPEGAGKGVLDTEPMDLAVQGRAKARRIPIAHVETLAEQAALLRTWNDTFLEGLGTVEPDAGAQSDAVSDLCFRADTRGAALLTEPGDPMADAILRGRNRAWVPRLLPALDEGGAFVAVGAGHMLGDDGLLDLLAEQGFTVTQLTTTRPPSDARLPALGGRVPAAPPVVVDLPAWEARLAPPLAAALCADGQLVRGCFEPDAERCTARLTTDAALCVRQHADRLPAEGGPPPDVRDAIAACVPAGLVLEAIATGRVGDGPLCGLVGAALQGAAK